MKTQTPLIPSSLHPLIPFFLLLLITSSLHSQVPAYVPTNGLVGYWPFNGNANDESGNGNNGTVNGATLTADRNGNANSAYSFDGMDDYIFCANVINQYSANFSVSGWFNLNDISPQQDPGFAEYDFISSWPGGCGQLLVRFDNFEGNPTIAVNSHGFCQYTFNSPNSWHHFLIVTSQSLTTLYIDGQFAASSAFSTEISLCNNLLNFGRQENYNGIGYMNGYLDDIAIYNRALTPTEITALYTGETAVSGCTNSTACNYNASATQDDGSCTFPAQAYLTCSGTCINDTDGDGICNELEVPTIPAYLPTNGLVGYWPFNGNANDESGNGNNGTVNGATLTTDRNGNLSAYNTSSGYITCSSNGIPDNNPMSVTFWFKNYSDFGLGEVICLGNSASTTWGIVLKNNYTTLNYGRGCGSSGSSPGLVSFNDTSWHQLTIVSFGLSLYSLLYLDGILQAEISNANSNGNCSNQNLFFGVDIYSSPELFDGSLDDIAIYNRALTPEEITALYTGATNNNSGGGGSTASGTPAESVPAGIPYQAVIRDSNGFALNNAAVTVRFSLHQGTTSGTVEYQETQALTTNAFGLINTQFGTGTATQGTFAGINWSNTTKFIQVEANTGSGYVDMGTQQMMSVPFAIKANESNKVKNAGLPVYADNAAALAGGLVAGEMYRTAAGILMIVY